MPPDAALARLLDGLEPAELALRDWVRTRLNASIVRELAAADYGWRAEEHRQGIEALLVARRLPADLAWTPGEVLRLSSHAVPADPQRQPGSPGWRAHVVRLFSCLVLVRADDTASPAGTLAGLVESALELGPEATDHAVRYLAWCRRHEPGAWRDDAEALPLLTLGLLLLYVMAPGRGDPGVAAGLARAFAGEAEALLGEHWWPGQAPAAALKAATGGNAWRIWRALVGRCLIDRTAGGGDPGDRLALLGRAITGQTSEPIEILRTWAQD
jgi:hypothetical protein